MLGWYPALSSPGAAEVDQHRPIQQLDAVALT
jgi:hypothetical protein